MLVSADGKISTGDTDALDVDRDYPSVDGVKEGLHQYYDLEHQTDSVSLNTGRVMAKIGVNEKEFPTSKIDVNFVIIDNQPHLTERGTEYLTKWCQKLYLVTTDPEHPAYSSQASNLVIIKYEEKIDFPDLFSQLKTAYGIEKMTIQSGGTLNASLVRHHLVDHLSLVIAPVLVGGKNTASLIDGESLHSLDDLHFLRPLKLVEAKPLEDSYLLLKYDTV